MGTQDKTGTHAFGRRYAEFRDPAGSWTFEFQEYQTDLDAVVPADVPPNPNPREAYRAAAFLEGFVQERKSTGNWSDDALDRFESFESTVEVEAVAKALREFGEDAEQ